MTWYCAECHTEQGVDAVCHHCGKPLCREDRVLIPDEAFAAGAELRDAVAVHCRPCRRQFHPGPYIQLP